ncbi:MAG: hypothetical protein A2014_05325 [Spirochaetes bacterium GWF1_49_6]|nr:MAG: hypothetical protein A2014_05325 [Spirochaetes bacterium GWF1_49_6]
MSERGGIEILRDIIESCDRILLFCDGLDYEGFIYDIKTQDAVLRNFEIIGEAVKSISETLKMKYPSIKWKQIAGMRDILIHHYFGVNWDMIWEIIHEDIPDLKEQINGIISDEYPAQDS